MNGASPKLQRAARAFLLRQVAENGVEEAARVLRELADALEWIEARTADERASRAAGPEQPNWLHWRATKRTIPPRLIPYDCRTDRGRRRSTID